MPSVASVNFALALAVAGLALSVFRVAVTSPSAQTEIWMLLVCRTPPISDLLDEPLCRRLMVVALLPNASRKA